ncbi:unnamed protein product [Triticum turgidum subsp. durum]|uniref:Alkyl transferase n=2 Tax=Triticum TaxID=4564 RepID=A0A9R1QSU5_TRITD|nr:unnamed protein product [Triticum aestivum]VAH81959.1 unnamed protein product [Triticum turgidum subsp. durum]
MEEEKWKANATTKDRKVLVGKKRLGIEMKRLEMEEMEKKKLLDIEVQKLARRLRSDRRRGWPDTVMSCSWILARWTRWRRSWELIHGDIMAKAEVDFLMGLFERVIHDSVAEFLRDGIRLRVIGDCSRLPASLRRTARDAEEATRDNSQLDLTLAISYSGRRDIVQACRSLAQKVRGELLRPEDIDESLFAGELETSRGSELPCPDLLIRTSGELRLSNFLLWQSAYSELFFTDTLWPDFGEADYLEALCSFQSRDRRFGRRNS